VHISKIRGIGWGNNQVWPHILGNVTHLLALFLLKHVTLKGSYEVHWWLLLIHSSHGYHDVM
jgi:hypothetical protein